MKQIIPPIDRSLLLKELNEKRFVRKANNGSNEIYIVNAHNSPYVMQEIGRLREVTFRNAGGGTGEETDIDSYDTSPVPYEQLIVWSPEDREIVGGYRYILGPKVLRDDKGIPKLATAHLLNFSKKFIDEFLPVTIELGRSFVQPQYQPSSENRKGLFSLDNLWDGLGALVVDNPDMKYLFGKVTMYGHFNAKARDMIIYFMNFYFPDNDKLVTAKQPVPYKTDINTFKDQFTKDLSYKDAHHLLNRLVRAEGENIPPLINAYMNISPSMRTFGTAINDTFGDVEETGIMVTIADVYPTKKDRHISSYKPKAKA